MVANVWESDWSQYSDGVLIAGPPFGSPNFLRSLDRAMIAGDPGLSASTDSPSAEKEGTSLLSKILRLNPFGGALVGAELAQEASPEIQNYVSRAVLIVLGLVLVGGALFMFGTEALKT